MKIGVPVMSDDSSLNNTICEHFGSAPFFAVIETESEAIKIVKNNNAHHEHGMCNPLAALAAERVDAVLVRGIGAGAIARLQNAKIPVYQAIENSLKSSIDGIKNNKLNKVSPEGACGGHGHGHSCH